MDFSQYSDEELQQIAGTQSKTQQDFSSISDDELMKIAGVQQPQQIQQPQKQKFVGGLVGQAIEDPRSLEAFGRKGLETITAGFGRKVIPAISAGVAKLAGVEAPIGELYKEARGLEAEKKAELAKEFPKATIAGAITGGVLSPINIAGLKTSKAVGGGLLGAMAGGGVEGAIAGLGYTGDMTDPDQVIKDITGGAGIGAMTGGALYGIGKGISAIAPILKKPFERFTNQKKLASKNIKKMLVKEGVDPKVALQRMTDEGLDLIDVVDPRSAIVSSLPEKTYEKASIDLVDDYVNRLNKGANKTSNEILDMVSTKKITDMEGAELMGKNAQEVINRQLKIRSAKAEPLYEKAFNQKKAQAILGKRDELLKRPVLKEAIRKAKAESRKFGKTTVGSLGKEIPLELDDLTDEFYQFTDFRKAYRHFKEIELTPEVAKKYRDFANPLRDKDKKEAFRTFYKEVSKNNSLKTLHQAKDYLYRKSKDFTDLENYRYQQVYEELSSKLKTKSTAYREATEAWAGETEGLERLYKQKGIGNIAKKYANNDIDGIRSSMKNMFKPATSFEEISRLKATMKPEEFQAIVRKDLSGMIEDAGEKGRVLDIALFGQAEDVGLKNRKLDLIFTPAEKKGLKKAVGIIDKARIRAKETAKIKFGKGAVQEAKHVSFNKIRMLSNTLNKIKETPAYREEFIRYITTPEGKQILEMINKADGKNAESLLFNLLGAIETTKRE
jgi:hypothetical protein